MWMKVTIGVLLLMSVMVMPARAVTVTAILGGHALCDTTVEACGGFPTQFVALCNSLIGGANCPSTFHPSWTESNRFWGASGNNCVTSINQGSTWSLCATQPFAGVAMQVAGATNGNVVAVASVAGVCTLRVSTDTAATWTTVFTDALQCALAASSSQVLKCQPTLGRCDFVSTVSNLRAFRSDDSGASWSMTTTIDVNVVGGSSLAVDNANGIAGGVVNFNRKVPLETLSVWSVSAAWPAAANNYGISSAYFSNLVPQTLTYDLVAVNYKRLSAVGLVQQTLTPVGALLTGSPMLAGLELSPGSNIEYLVGCNNTGGGQAFWISIDDLINMVSLATNTQACGLATLYHVHGQIFIAVAGVGSFYRIS